MRIFQYLSEKENRLSGVKVRVGEGGKESEMKREKKRWVKNNKK